MCVAGGRRPNDVLGQVEEDLRSFAQEGVHQLCRKEGEGGEKEPRVKEVEEKLPLDPLSLPVQLDPFCQSPSTKNVDR